MALDMTISVRFQEEQHYDIRRDCEVVRFMATTSLGSYWTELPMYSERMLRRDRERFKEKAVEAIRAQLIPCYIDLDEMTEH